MRILLICALALITADVGATQARNNSTSDPYGFMILLTVSKASQCLVCSGSLVAKNWILTAAHCVHDVDFVVASVSAAFEDNCSRSTNISRSDIFIHPLFRIKSGFFPAGSTNLFHDIALIRFTPEIACVRMSPVRFPDKNVRKQFYYNKSVLLVRFKLSCSHYPRLFRPRLSIVTVENIAQGEYCPFHAKDSAIEISGEPIEYDKLCVFPQELRHSCFGDTSGHLLMPLTGELIGFMSNPKKRDCGIFDRVLFTQVSYYVPWIEGVISCVEKCRSIRCDGLHLTERKNEHQPTNNIKTDPFSALGFMVKLEVFKDGQCSVCSASFVAKNWIVTAAHCIHKANNVVAYIGPPFKGNCSNGHKIRKNDFFIHPSFDVKENEVFHDIALIRFTYNTSCNRLSSVRLPDKNTIKTFLLYENKRVLWFRFDLSCGMSPPIFLESARIFQLDDYCLSGNRSTLKEDQLCVNTERYENKNICLGDASGHLIMPTGELIGFMSSQRERDCGILDHILFTQVSYYMPWIEGIISCIEKCRSIRCDGLPLTERKDNENQPTNNIKTDPFVGLGFMVKLEVSQDRQCSVCSASFVAKNWIVTAAHCIHKANDVVAYIGPPFEGNCSNGHKIRKNDFFIHPSFAENENELFHDIALIRFTYNTSCNRLSSVRLPDKNINKTFLFYENKRVLWFRFDASCGISPPIYVESASILQLGDYCLPGNRSALKEDQLCVYTGRYENTNTCLGDASGHLIMPTGELIGFMSNQSTRSCNKFDYIIFTQVHYYKSWIEKVTGVNKN